MHAEGTEHLARPRGSLPVPDPKRQNAGRKVGAGNSKGIPPQKRSRVSHQAGERLLSIHRHGFCLEPPLRTSRQFTTNLEPVIRSRWNGTEWAPSPGDSRERPGRREASASPITASESPGCAVTHAAFTLSGNAANLTTEWSFTIWGPAGCQRNFGRGAFGILPVLGIGPLGICSDCGSAFSR